MSGTPKTVKDIMNPKLLYIREGDRLSLARARILEFGVTAVPVLDEEHRPVGVVSLRDLAEDAERPVASGDVKVLRGDVGIEAGARFLAEGGLHHVVVVDARGVAIGMASAIDFLRALSGMPDRHPPMFDRY